VRYRIEVSGKLLYWANGGEELEKVVMELSDFGIPPEVIGITIDKEYSGKEKEDGEGSG
jgi:hypothetical protein